MNYDKDRYIGYVEMALGVGDMAGPAIGGFTYDALGFSGTFASFGAMIFIGIVLSVMWIPKQLNLMSSLN
jgi:predicted MFS family arabinose efflux permease